MDEIVDVFKGSYEKYGKFVMTHKQFGKMILSDYPYYYCYSDKGKMMILANWFEGEELTRMYLYMENKKAFH